MAKKDNYFNDIDNRYDDYSSDIKYDIKKYLTINSYHYLNEKSLF